MFTFFKRVFNAINIFKNFAKPMPTYAPVFAFDDHFKIPSTPLAFESETSTAQEVFAVQPVALSYEALRATDEQSSHHVLGAYQTFEHIMPEKMSVTPVSDVSLTPIFTSESTETTVEMPTPVTHEVFAEKQEPIAIPLSEVMHAPELEDMPVPFKIVGSKTRNTKKNTPRATRTPLKGRSPASVDTVVKKSNKKTEFANLPSRGVSRVKREKRGIQKKVPTKTRARKNTTPREAMGFGY
jgi:hypothetical protein